ncbi:DUF3574 domain-containing protein [Pelomyxa schiedti]|nr:DUF3574 domain-containing protein [Pelomyxa schiedti]
MITATTSSALVVLMLSFLVTRSAGGSSPSGGWLYVSDWARSELYFGLSIQLSNGTTVQITSDQFNEWMGRVVTPLFPDGLTTWSASGQWLSASSDIVKEDSQVMVIYHPDTSASSESIASIVSSYMDEFQQEAVLFSTNPENACLSPDLCLSHSYKWSATNIVAVVAVIVAIFDFAVVIVLSLVVLCLYKKLQAK